MEEATALARNGLSDVRGASRRAIDATVGLTGLVVESTPYTAPFGLLGRIRSAGITDLRPGSLLDEDWQGRDRFAHGEDVRRPVPLPEGVACFAIAGTTAPLDDRQAELPATGSCPSKVFDLSLYLAHRLFPDSAAAQSTLSGPRVAARTPRRTRPRAGRPAGDRAPRCALPPRRGRPGGRRRRA